MTGNSKSVEKNQAELAFPSFLKTERHTEWQLFPEHQYLRTLTLHINLILAISQSF